RRASGSPAELVGQGRDPAAERLGTADAAHRGEAVELGSLVGSQVDLNRLTRGVRGRHVANLPMSLLNLPACHGSFHGTGPTRARGTRGGARHGSCPPRRRNHRPSVEMVETRTRRSPVFVRNVLLAALCTASLAALPDMVEAQSARA